ncbi:hypothetical protein JCM12298_08820 [Desulfothermus naphthae]
MLKANAGKNKSDSILTPAVKAASAMRFLFGNVAVMENKITYAKCHNN